MRNKAHWIDLAETVDAMRVFPRLLLFSSFAFMCWYSWFALSAALHLIETISGNKAGGDFAAAAQGIAGGVIGVTVPMIGNMFSKIVDVYMNTGRQWDGK